MPKPFTIDPLKEAEAAKALRESLGAVAAEDGQLLIDMVEGETSLMEAFDLLLEAQIQDKANCIGIRSAIEQLEIRSARFMKRIETAKALMEQAIVIANIDGKIERPLATLFMSKRAPKVEITTEADIPARFWKPSDPVLDKKAIGDALKERAAAVEALGDIADPEARKEAIDALPPDVPGAVLSNAAPTLTVRFS